MNFRTILASVLALAATAALAVDGPHVPREKVTVHGKDYYLGYIPGHLTSGIYTHPRIFDLPLAYDAIADHKATGVKSPGQGQCGDCWAWARTSSLEAAVLEAGQPGISLSEQDTTVNARDEHGCNGGMMDFNYEINHGVTTLSQCPWANGHGRCRSRVAAKGVSMAYIGDQNGPTDQELMSAIYQYGSVAVTIAVDNNFDVDQGSDRVTSCDTTQVDHMVSLVGYRPSPDGGVEFRVKNSWGAEWGAGGYAYLARGCDQLAVGDQSAMVITID